MAGPLPSFRRNRYLFVTILKRKLKRVANLLYFYEFLHGIVDSSPPKIWTSYTLNA